MPTETLRLATEQMLKMANELFIARKTHDIEKLLSLYHPECLIEYPGLGIKHRGHASVRAGMALFKSIFRDYENEKLDFAFDGNTLISWGQIKMTLAGNFSGHMPNGRRVRLTNFMLLKFSDNSIIYEAQYPDLANLCFQSGLPLEAMMQIKT